MPNRGKIIRDAMLAQGLSQKTLADRSGCSTKSIQRALDGWMSEQTARRIMKVLGSGLFDSSSADSVSAALPCHGSYLRHAVDDYIGEYACFRRTFIDEGKIFASHMSVKWSDDSLCLSFEKAVENEKSLSVDAEKAAQNIRYCKGDVYISFDTGAVHFLSCSRGAVFLMTALRMDDEKVMRGAVLMATELDGPGVRPACAPIVVQKLPVDVDHEWSGRGVRVIDIKDDEGVSINKELVATENFYTIFSLIDGGKGTIDRRYMRKRRVETEEDRGQGRK